MLPPASPMAVATRPSMPGRWSISTRRTIEYCAETGGMGVEDATSFHVAHRSYNLYGMKDGKLSEVDGRYELRFVRPLAHPVEKVWRA